MDVNRIELLGRVCTPPVFREAKNGGEWVSFAVATNILDYTTAGLASDFKNTFTQVSVFMPKLIEKVKNAALKVGDRIWVCGNLATKRTFQKGSHQVFFFVAVSNLEVLRNSRNEKYDAANEDFDYEVKDESETLKIQVKKYDESED